MPKRSQVPLTRDDRIRLMDALQGLTPQQREAFFRLDERALFRALCGDGIQNGTLALIRLGLQQLETGAA